MTEPELTRGLLERWFFDVSRRPARQMSGADAAAAPAGVSVSAMSAWHGVALRVSTEGGGEVDVFLNAALAMCVRQAIEEAGQASGWLDERNELIASPAQPDRPSSGN